jgi:ferredoxin-type protein NapH
MRSANQSAAKIAVLYFYMYLVGPLIWGVWMIFRLKIVTLQEYLHCLLSLPVLILLPAYFLVNLIISIKILKNMSAPSSGTSVLRLSTISVVSFGGVATFVFLSMLSTNSCCHNIAIPENWLEKAILGTSAGASLVLMFYIFFSTTIFMTIAEKSGAAFWGEDNERLLKMKRINKLLYATGVILFIGSSAASCLYTGSLSPGGIVSEKGLLFLVTLSFPVFMSWLLYKKARAKIDSVIDPSSGKKYRRKMTVLRRAGAVRPVVQAVSLLVFLFLLLTHRSRLWVIPLIAGFVSSLLLGRAYCGWLCPVNTISGLMEKVLKKLHLNKSAAPINGRLAGLIVFIVFLALFVVSLALRIQPQLFLIITLSGVLISTVFASSYWCISLCPWGTIFRFLIRFSLFKLMIGKEQCVRCGKCARSCPSGALTACEEPIDFTRCLHCLKCAENCGKNAIAIRKGNPVISNHLPLSPAPWRRSCRDTPRK